MKRLAIGLCTVSTRKVGYLEQTLSSVFENLTPGGRMQTVVCVYDCNAKGAPPIAVDRFNRELASGALRVERVDNHPSFENLPLNFGDTPERVRWRTKQNFDYSEAFRRSHNLAEYYLHIEDDLVACQGFDRYIFDVVASNRDWSYLRFAQGGFIGLLFRNEDLPKMSALLHGFRDEMPCDWLIRHFADIKQRSGYEPLGTPYSIFQHVGYERSLPNGSQPVVFDNFIR